MFSQTLIKIELLSLFDNFEIKKKLTYIYMREFKSNFFDMPKQLIDEDFFK